MPYIQKESHLFYKEAMYDFPSTFSPSSGDSDDGRIICHPDERIMKEESRESETECDRICK